MLLIQNINTILKNENYQCVSAKKVSATSYFKVRLEFCIKCSKTDWEITYNLYNDTTQLMDWGYQGKLKDDFDNYEESLITTNIIYELVSAKKAEFIGLFS